MKTWLVLLACLISAIVLADDIPGHVVNLDAWKLTLPEQTERQGNPDEILQPELTKLRDPRFFDVLQGGAGVVFRAPCGGATTNGSDYPRTELREMQTDGITPASWGISDGATHALTAKLAITRLPRRKPHVIRAQIHDDDGKLFALRVEGSKLLAEGDGQKDVRILDNYTLGTPLQVCIVARNGAIQLFLDNRAVLNWSSTRVGCFFKIGCYTQSNVKKGDAPDEFGEVVLYDLQLSHTPIAKSE